VKNFALCLVILVLGTAAFHNFTNAKSTVVLDAQDPLSHDLSDSDLRLIKGIVDERIDTVVEDLRMVERELSDKIEALQTKLCDCNTRAEQSVKAEPPKVKSEVVESMPVVVQGIPYAKPIVRSGSHWTYPGDITSHLEADHGQIVNGMSIEQQLSLHDSLHESQRVMGTARTVTRSRVQSGGCPGGVCPTSSQARPRLYTGRGIFWRR
jgi:hypothetical protein